MRASLKGTAGTDKNRAGAASLGVPLGELKLRASITEATVVNGPSLNGLLLSVEKPGSFIIDYDIPKKAISVGLVKPLLGILLSFYVVQESFIWEQWISRLVFGVKSGCLNTSIHMNFGVLDSGVQDFRFQFMNKVKIMEKPLSLTYIHGKGDNRTLLEGTLAFDPCNKLSANYMVGPGNCKLKYSYVHGGLTTFEPSYDLSKNSWDLAVSRKVYGDDVLKATYQTSSRILGLEWSLNSLLSSRAKVSASVNLNEESKIPKVSAETTWNFDM
ncbi:hypothetical protein CDL15_Pgr006861 [Punica granatum]|uniref:Uncharacterized protein n=1 Tax=Punica granatum TaxID=22663 RepID=A0A218X803_PUNGR|nr:hypothetical protein CDL15_Pgr006861 [Punica granatum]